MSREEWFAAVLLRGATCAWPNKPRTRALGDGQTMGCRLPNKESPVGVG